MQGQSRLAVALFAITTVSAGVGDLRLNLTRPSLAAEGRPAENPVRGVVRARHQATISTEQPLLVLSAPLREGDRFKKGDILFSFDCRKQQADHGAATAAYREAVLNFESSQQLDRFKAVGRNDLEIARTRAERMKHEQVGIAAKLDECQLVAPFDGRVVEIFIRRFERTQPQRPYVSILDDSELEIEAIVPSHTLTQLSIGSTFRFRVDELVGEPAKATVSAIAAAVDPISKTVKIFGKLSEPVPGLLAGMSGTAHFQLEK